MACGIFPWKLFRCENNSLARAASALPTNPHATHFHLSHAGCSHFSLNVCLKTAKLQSFDKTGTTYFFEQFTTMLSKSRLSLITYQTQHILILQYIFNWIFKVLVDCFNSKPSPQVRSSWSCWKQIVKDRTNLSDATFCWETRCQASKLRSSETTTHWPRGAV